MRNTHASEHVLTLLIGKFVAGFGPHLALASLIALCMAMSTSCSVLA